MTDDLILNVMFPDEYKDFVAEICYKGECFCTVTQEDGPLVFSIEFGNCSERVPFDAFVEMLQRAKQRLFELRITED